MVVVGAVTGLGLVVDGAELDWWPAPGCQGEARRDWRGGRAPHEESAIAPASATADRRTLAPRRAAAASSQPFRW